MFVNQRGHCCPQLHTLSLSLCVCVCAGGIRLVGGSVPSEGRVELFYEGEWGGVNDDIYTTAAAAARVACQQVGYPYSNGTGYFGQGSGPVWVSIRSCTGDEEKIEQCSHDGWRDQFRSPYPDFGVRCRGECVQSVKHTHAHTRTHARTHTHTHTHTVYQGVLTC